MAKWRLSMWLWIGTGVLLLCAGGMLGLKRYFERPMFEPGTTSARIAAAGETLDPPPSGSTPDVWAVTDDIGLRHVTQGLGDDALIVHGGPGFPPRAPWGATRELARFLRVHAYEARGCGGSTRPFDRAPGRSFPDRLRAVESKLGFAEQVADIERIRRLLGAERLVVIGHSFGALVAALYAAEFPERVRALVLVAPAPLVVMPKQGADLFALVRERLPAARRTEYDRYLEGYFDFGRHLGEDEPTLSRYFGRMRDFYAEAVGATTPPANDGDAGGLVTLAMYAGLGRRHDWRPALARIRAPTLVLHGARDLQPEDDSRSFAAAIPGARFAVLDGGHFLPDDAPVAFASAVHEILAR